MAAHRDCENERQKALNGASNYTTPNGVRCLLPPQTPANRGKKCLVLDLDETLVHSSFHPTACFDFQIKVEIDGIYHDVFVAKRPGVDLFLERAAEKFELVIFTASLAKYADPVLDTLDPKGYCYWRLFRDSCVGHGSQFVKDMSILGRPAESAMILDNSPTSYMFQPEQAIPIESWFDDPDDRMLLQLLPILDELAECDNVIHGLRRFFQH
jgi:RNA polymerase II subunit A small phosphatase-like protein